MKNLKIAEDRLADYFRGLSNFLGDTIVTDRQGNGVSLEEGIHQTVERILSLKKHSGKALLVGNGGSAAIVSHVQNDLCATVGVRALVFNEPSLLTALTNDYGYETAFERLVSLWADPLDLLVAVSSSGKSENILRAAKVATAKECQVITFSGFRSDNPLRSLGDLNFYIPFEAYGPVETSHQSLLHWVTDLASITRRAQEK